MTTYYNLPADAHDARAIELVNFPDRYVIMFYNHQENLHFAPWNENFSGSDVLETENEDFAAEFSYPSNVAHSIVEQVNR